jgi:hypothetical protein
LKEEKIPMKAMFGALAAPLCLAGSAGAEMQACDVTVDVIDTDPKGTNVRETPAGKVIAALKTSSDQDDWIEVHILGQSGDWFLIDGAKLIGDSEKTIFGGKGYAHRSVLGSNGLQNGATIWADHDQRSQMLVAHLPGDQQVDFLGCWGDFVKVHAKNGTGWTRQLCLNQRTTCA